MSHPANDPTEAASGPGGRPLPVPESAPEGRKIDQSASEPRHPSWCYLPRCDAGGVGGAHRSEPTLIPSGDTGTSVLAGLWQSTGDPATRLRLVFSDGLDSVSMILTLAQANLLSNVVADLVVAAGVR